MELKGKIVTVLGLGNSGLNAALLLRDLGAIVKATDSGDTPSARNSARILRDLGIEVETGRHTERFIKNSDLVVASPGVEPASQAMVWAKSFRIPVIGEMELGFRYCKGRIIAITGTNGKSTVTTLVGEILKDAGLDAVVCGNIGNSLCGEISRIKDDTWVVLEVSSFQLETIKSFKPHIALILNITDDHMDRYNNFEEYFNEKLKIFSNQSERDILILNYDAQNLRSLKDKADSKVIFYSRLKPTNGAYIKAGRICCVSGTATKEILSLADISLKGLHNVENVLASALIGTLVGVNKNSIRDTVKSFRGLAHRVETVAVVNGVEYIDDSKGTTVDSTYRALEACDKPVILIAGGKDKHSDYSRVLDIVKKKVKALVLIGEAREAIKKALRGAVDMFEAKDMFDAVSIAHGTAEKDWIVLLSPMCSSFDMFKDYKERGEAFKKAVFMINSSSSEAKV